MSNPIRVHLSDPDTVLKFYPELDGATAEKLARMRGGILTHEAQQRFINLFRRGMSKSDCCEKLKVGMAFVSVTAQLHKDFAREIKSIEKGQRKQVEAELVKYVTGKVRQVKKTWVAKLDELGEPLLDDNGNQVFWCSKKEVTTVPPQPALVQFFLQKRFPEVYGDIQPAEKGYVSPSELAAKLEQALQQSDPGYRMAS